LGNTANTIPNNLFNGLLIFSRQINFEKISFFGDEISFSDVADRNRFGGFWEVELVFQIKSSLVRVRIDGDSVKGDAVGVAAGPGLETEPVQQVENVVLVKQLGLSEKQKQNLSKKTKS
jgi:hypothetical protein